MIPGAGFATTAANRAAQPVVLPTSEVFGPTYQGEGPATGRVCWFVRLGLCNLACEWCDTPYTWDTTRYDVAAECPDTPVDVILGRLADLGATDGSLVVLSGGEPLMHHPRLPALLDPRHRWHVETNGTIAPPPWWADRVEHTTVSPKVITNDPHRKRIKPRALRAWTDLAHQGAAAFKFVCRVPADVDDVAALTASLGVPPGAVWVMPEGTATGTVLDHHRAIVDTALTHRFNTTTRLHTLLWGDERGH